MSGSKVIFDDTKKAELTSNLDQSLILYFSWNGHTYHLSWRAGQTKLTWRSAQNYCRRRNQAIISLDSTSKTSHFLSLLQQSGAGTPYFWTGGRLSGGRINWENRNSEQVKFKILVKFKTFKNLKICGWGLVRGPGPGMGSGGRSRTVVTARCVWRSSTLTSTRTGQSFMTLLVIIWNLLFVSKLGWFTPILFIWFLLSVFWM